ncbi:MAG: transposase [Oscillospiraceae bacterium]|nr:transposase [Oscillospiraceae bacterium]
MDRPKRKPNRLSQYDYSQPGGYFITICTKGRKEVLGTVVGADVLIGPQVTLTELGEQVRRVLEDMPSVDKYVVMPNHIHMVVRLPDENGAMRTSPPTRLPAVVRYFKRSITQVTGENVWQRGYHDHIIRNEEDYLRIWEYIDTNPAKWREDCYYTEVER